MFERLERGFFEQELFCSFLSRKFPVRVWILYLINLVCCCTAIWRSFVMTKNSRHKSHKQNKHVSKDDKLRSDSDEDVKIGDNSKEGASSRSLERRKPAVQSRDGGEVVARDNTNGFDEFVSSKRRGDVKDMKDPRGSGRWNSRLVERQDAVFGKDSAGEVPQADLGKSKLGVDSKSRSKKVRGSSREKDEFCADDKEKNRASKPISKNKPHKELKEVDRLSIRDRKVENIKRVEVGGEHSEDKKKWEIRGGDIGEERKAPRPEKTGPCIPNESRNPELEKELDKRMRRRASGLSDREKYHDDRRGSDEKRVFSRDEYEKDVKYRDDRNRHDNFKEREMDGHRDSRQKDVKPREDADREKRDKYRDEQRSRDRISDRPNAKHARDEIPSAENVNKKSRGNHDKSPAYDERSKKYRDESDSRSRKSEGEKKSSSYRVEAEANQGRSSSRHAGQDRRKNSFSPSTHDKYRHAKQVEYKDMVPHKALTKEAVSFTPSLTKVSTRATKSVMDSGTRGPYYGKGAGTITDTHTGDDIFRAGENSRGMFAKSSPSSLGRSGMDSPSVEEDSRGKSNKRAKRLSDPNSGRAPNNAWKGIPGWQTPVANGFIPFQHGPPVGYPTMMQQFSPASMFGARPSMELNNTGVPYHFADADKFSNPPSRPFLWRGPIDGSYPPFHVFDWDHNRSMMGDWSWDASSNMWRPAGSQKEGYLSLPVSGNEQNQGSDQAGVKVEGAEVVKSALVGKESKRAESDRHAWRAYLSKLDISEDLTQPELYEKCKTIVNKKDNDVLMDGALIPSYAELDAAVDDVLMDGALVPSYLEMDAAAGEEPSDHKATLLLSDTAYDDALFKRIMSFYEKQKEENHAVYQQESESGKVEELIPALDAEMTCMEEKVKKETDTCGGVLDSPGTGNGADEADDNGSCAEEVEDIKCAPLANISANASKVPLFACLSRIHQSTH